MSEETFEKVVLDIARGAINNCLIGSYKLNVEALKEEYPALNDNRATFVTLKLHGDLRGCIGSLQPSKALIEDIIHNAKAAAFNDPRFAPLSLDEFEKTEIEVSILSLPQSLKYEDIEDLKSKIKVGQHGVILKKDSYQSTFLPQVWEQLPTFELFFEHLCLKAGLQESCLASHPEIKTYTVKKIRE